MNKRSAAQQTYPDSKSEKHSFICAFRGTPLFDYAVRDNSSAAMTDDAVSVFELEASELLNLSQCGADCAVRFENRRLFIVKVLLYVGVTSRDNALPIISGITEIFVNRPEMEFNAAVGEFSKHMSVPEATVTRMIEKYFDVYDDRVRNKVRALTQTNPLTTKDMLYDIAVYIRAKYSENILRYEQTAK